MKYKLFRRIALLLAFSALFSACAGCSSKDDHGLDPDKPVSIMIWHYYNGVQQQTFDDMVLRFNQTLGKEKGIIVEASSQGSVNELSQKVLDALDAKVGAQKTPQVVAAYADTAYSIDARNMAADISQYLTPDEIAEYIPAYFEEGDFKGNGCFKLFPIAKSTEVLLVNTTDWEHFSSATGASDGDFATWEGLSDVSRRYYEWTDEQTPDVLNDGKAFFGRDAMANHMIVGSMQLGSELFSVSDGAVTYNIDEHTMRRIWTNYYVPYVNGWFAAVGRFRSDDVKTGDIASFVGSTTGATYFPKAVTLESGVEYPVDVKAYTVPNFEGCPPYAVQQGAGMLITKSNETLEYASTVFLKWFTEAENNWEFCLNSGYLPVKAAAATSEMLETQVKLQSLSKDSALYGALDCGIKTTSSFKLYTNKAFDCGISARAIANLSLQRKCDADLALVLADVAGGISRADAAKKYTTDENFKLWLSDFTAELNACR